MLSQRLPELPPESAHLAGKSANHRSDWPHSLPDFSHYRNLANCQFYGRR